jgi:Tol biopolymer transport system component
VLGARSCSLGSIAKRLHVGARRLTPVISDGTHPYWSPDGSRISYQPCDAYSDCSLQIAEADGTHVVEFGYGRSGPWNPLVQP